MRVKIALLTLLFISNAKATPLPFVDPPLSSSSQSFLYTSALLMALKSEASMNLAALERYPGEGRKKQLLVQNKLCDINGIIQETEEFMIVNKKFYGDTFNEMFDSLNKQKNENLAKLEADCKVLSKELRNFG